MTWVTSSLSLLFCVRFRVNSRHEISWWAYKQGITHILPGDSRIVKFVLIVKRGVISMRACSLLASCRQASRRAHLVVCCQKWSGLSVAIMWLHTANKSRCDSSLLDVTVIRDARKLILHHIFINIWHTWRTRCKPLPPDRLLCFFCFRSSSTDY